jgi:uncharacterized protein (UPF0276 family)
VWASALRWEFLEEVLDGPPLDIAFFEVSPENYMRRGGYYPAALERIGARYPLVTHGLTLSIGSHAAPDREYLAELKDEVERLATPWHSDHLAFTSGAGARSTSSCRCRSRATRPLASPIAWRRSRTCSAAPSRSRT